MSRTPLIVSCAFGTAHARILQLSLQSLRAPGLYAGRIVVLTDLEPRALIAACPRACAPEIDIVRVPVADELTGRLCRYDLHSLLGASHIAAAEHAPILCLEADIVFDRPLLPMLDAVRLASRICFPAESCSSMTSHAMGGNLLRALGRTDAGRGFHASAYGVPDGASPAHQATLERIAATARKLWTARPTLFRQWIDQPVANYLHALSGGAMFDTETLAAFFRWSVRDEVPEHAAARRLGAVHFADGHRIERMRAYFDHLTAPDDTARPAPGRVALLELAASRG